jgi:phospholipid/cholesterol/gamma-HCH transport system ATP-binding protein
MATWKKMGKNKVKDPIISVKGLTIGYQDSTVLENVSFDVSPGEVFAILGRSGCGKTTLFKTLFGLLEPMSGEVVIDGDKVMSVDDSRSEKTLRKIGVLFQSAALFSSMTIAENIALPLRQYTGFSKNTIERLVSFKLASVGLSGYGERLPSEISGGMRRRAGLARSTALDPLILFFDEPSAGLDPVTSAGLDELILEINRTLGTTMVVVTHELASIMTIADRVILLDPEEKNIIAQGPPKDLMKKSTDSRVLDFFSRSSPRDDGEPGIDSA